VHLAAPREVERLTGSVPAPLLVAVFLAPACAVRMAPALPPSGLAAAAESPVTLPVQSLSRHTTEELAWVDPDRPGIIGELALAPERIPVWRSVVAVALLPTVQPDPLLRHSPLLPEVLVPAGSFAAPRAAVTVAAPVVAAAHELPPPAHCAEELDSDSVAGAFSTGLAASFAASVAAFFACPAAVAASVAAFFFSAVAPGRAAVARACSASCCARSACCAACSAVPFRASLITSATTWPDPAVELVVAWQLLSLVVQLPLEDDSPAGGPRAPAPPVVVLGPSLPAAELRAMPEQPPEEPEQSSVADALDQLDAPGTVGAPELADEPGAVGAGGVAGWSWPGRPCGASAGAWSWPSSPVVALLTVAFAVEVARTSGLMLLASGPLEAPEFVTAWHRPADTPAHEPSPREPRGSGEVEGSVAVAALLTLPSQTFCPSQSSTAPAAEAAEGPAGRRAGFTAGFALAWSAPGWFPWAWSAPAWVAPGRASTAPGAVRATELASARQAAVPAAQVADPAEVRGLPPATAPSHAAEAVCALPEQSVPPEHSTEALADEVLDGPLVGWPFTGCPVAGSIWT
jgi:hypothetical protein